MLIIFILLLLPTLFLWLYTVAVGLSLHGSDAAGDSLGRALAGLAAIALWVFLGLLLIVTACWGEIPFWSAALGFILLPTSGYAAQIALQVMAQDRQLKWPIIVRAIPPGLLIAYFFWSLFPSIHPSFLPTIPAIIAWAPILILCPLPWLARLQHQRAIYKSPDRIAKEKADDAEQHHRQIVDAFQALTPDSPLQQWWDFTEPGNEFRTQALQGARLVNSRQQDVVSMVTGGKLSVFLAIPTLDLQPTPELEQAVRAYLLDGVQRLMPYDPARPITTKVVTEWYEQFFPTIRWLVDNHRSCNAELTALAAAVSKYPDTPERQKFLATLQTFQTASA